MLRGYIGISWLLLPRHELDCLETDAERKAAELHVFNIIERRRSFRIIDSAVFTALMLVFVTQFGPWLRTLHWWTAIAVIALSGICMGVINMLARIAWIPFYRRQAAAALRDFLIAHGHLVCRQCGYSLRSISEQRCPECGEVIPNEDQ